MLRLAERWVWDSWPLDDDGAHHLFYLQAPRQLGDPRARHTSATVGHAVSTDHSTWEVLPDALGPSAGPAWDDLAIWTGSVLPGAGGGWHLFYSAISRAENGRVQRIGRADSDDLVHWRRHGDRPLVSADPRWYETLGTDPRRAEAWRDPWVFADPGGDGWHMLITARLRHGPNLTRGVLGHARSPDLDHWTVQPPLTGPAGFGHLEVPQVTRLGGRSVLTFGCQAADLATGRRRRDTPRTGTWSAPAASPAGPFDMAAAVPFADPSLYAAHLVILDDGRPALLGFTGEDPFEGVIAPPRPVRLTSAGVLAPDDRIA